MSMYVFIFIIAITFISHIIWTHTHDNFGFVPFLRKVIFVYCLIYVYVFTLLLLSLTGNRIGDAGATQLADALQRNSTLTALDLGGKHDIIYVVVCHYFQCN